MITEVIFIHPETYGCFMDDFHNWCVGGWAYHIWYFWLKYNFLSYLSSLLKPGIVETSLEGYMENMNIRVHSFFFQRNWGFGATTALYIVLNKYWKLGVFTWFFWDIERKNRCHLTTKWQHITFYEKWVANYIKFLFIQRKFESTLACYFITFFNFATFNRV